MNILEHLAAKSLSLDLEDRQPVADVSWGKMDVDHRGPLGSDSFSVWIRYCFFSYPAPLKVSSVRPIASTPGAKRHTSPWGSSHLARVEVATRLLNARPEGGFDVASHLDG